MSKTKIAFFRIWPLPPNAVSVARLLRDTFPEFEIAIFDFARIIKKDIIVVAINSCFTFLLYGIGILSGKRRFKNCFWRTPFIFHHVRKLSAKLIPGEEVAFSFQLGSIIDASVEHIPHFIYTDHTHLANLSYPGFDRTDLYARRWIQLEKTTYQNAKMIFTRSTNISRSLIDLYDVPSQKVACVYVGINVAPFSGKLFNNGYRNKNILFVGVDWPRKGGPDLVEAFKIVLRTHSDARLTIVGCSPDIDLPNCDVIGKVPVNEMSNYYERASVFCMPTYLEPFGAVYIEAFSYKLPVVATNIGAIPDFVLDDENGYLVEPGDIAGLAESLNELISSAEKCKLFGERGNALVRERYNWETVGAAMRKHIFTHIGIEETGDS